MDIVCPHCKTELDAECDEMGNRVACPWCGKFFIVGADYSLKGRMISCLRWIGVPILPLLAACVAQILARISLIGAGRYIDLDPNGFYMSYIQPICDNFIAGMVIPLTAYWVAPRAKFYACSIVGTVYAAFIVFCFLLALSRSPQGYMWVKQAVLVGSIIYGIVYTKNHDCDWSS